MGYIVAKNNVILSFSISNFSGAVVYGGPPSNAIHSLDVSTLRRRQGLVKQNTRVLFNFFLQEKRDIYKNIFLRQMLFMYIFCSGMKLIKKMLDLTVRRQGGVGFSLVSEQAACSKRQ